MKKFEVTCDHCGKKLDPVKDFLEESVEVGNRWCIVDLCEDCFNELYAIVEQFLGEKK